MNSSNTSSSPQINYGTSAQCNENSFIPPHHHPENGYPIIDNGTNEGGKQQSTSLLDGLVAERSLISTPSSSHDDENDDEDLFEDADNSEYEYDDDSFGGEELFYNQVDIDNVICPNVVQQQQQVDFSFNQDPVECPICFTTHTDPGTALTLQNCNHSFCIQCFQSYVQTQMNDGKANRLICPMPPKECCKLIPQSVLNEVLDEKQLLKLENFRKIAFVNENSNYHHCPTPNCPNVLFWKKGFGLPVGDCFECGQVSCLQCGTTPYHTNYTCEEWKKYQLDEGAAAIAAATQAPPPPPSSHILSEMMNDFERPFGGGGGGAFSSSPLWSTRPYPTIPQFGTMGPIVGPSSSSSQRHRSTIDRSRADETLNHNFHPTEEWMIELNIRTCRRCGSGVQKADGGCLKMKCRCGYRFCFQCGSENAQCDCTPSHHGFTDNLTGRGDFHGLRETTSYT